MTALDSRAPHVLDTHELGRRPGTALRVHRVLPVPSDLVVGLASVPADAELEVDLTLEAVMEGVFVTLSTVVPVVAECARCLDDLSLELPVDAQELYAYPADDLDEDALVVHGDLLDLEPVLRDAIGLSLPGTLLCDDNCPGLCPDCGVRLADNPDHPPHDAVDPRWAALRDLAAGTDTTTPDEQTKEH